MHGRLYDSFKISSTEKAADMSLLESGVYILALRNIASRDIVDRIKIVIE